MNLFRETPINELGLPAGLVVAFQMAGFNSAESVYGVLLSTPEILEPMLGQYDLCPSQLRTHLRKLLPAEVISDLDELASRPPQGMGMGYSISTRPKPDGRRSLRRRTV